MVFERTTFIASPAEEVFAFFSRPENLATITPPELGFTIRKLPDGGIRRGARIEYRIRVARIPLTWVTKITHWEPPHRFVDEQERGPYRKWIHTHTFEERDGGVLMHDRVEYELPFGLPGRLVAGRFVRRQIEHIFDYRAARILERFASR
jgi:uncharacterized protein